MNLHELEDHFDRVDPLAQQGREVRLAYVTLENHPRCAECLKALGVDPKDCKPLDSPEPCACNLTRLTPRREDAKKENQNP
jgi:hypothetical protein